MTTDKYKILGRADRAQINTAKFRKTFSVLWKETRQSSDDSSFYIASLLHFDCDFLRFL